MAGSVSPDLRASGFIPAIKIGDVEINHPLGSVAQSYTHEVIAASFNLVEALTLKLIQSLFSCPKIWWRMAHSTGTPILLSEAPFDDDCRFQGISLPPFDPDICKW